jgi:uncharacterized protein (DUF58 family)
VEVEEVFARFREIKAGIKSTRKAASISFGDHKSGFQGTGYDIVGVERWRPGEPLKDVAWSLSLRTYPDKLYRVARMEPKELRTLIVVDLSYSTLFQISQHASKAVLLLDLIGVIGLTHAKMNDPVGLLGFSDRIELFLKPKLGSTHVFYMAHRIFDKLRHEQTYPSKRRARFPVAFEFIAGLKARHSVVVISDLVDLINDQESIDFRQLSRLASKHDITMLILDDPAEFRVSSRLGHIRIADMETGEHTVVPSRKAAAVRFDVEKERERLRAALRRQSGIDSVVLAPHGYFNELSKFLAQRTAR